MLKCLFSYNILVFHFENQTAKVIVLKSMAYSLELKIGGIKPYYSFFKA